VPESLSTIGADVAASGKVQAPRIAEIIANVQTRESPLRRTVGVQEQAGRVGVPMSPQRFCGWRFLIAAYILRGHDLRHAVLRDAARRDERHHPRQQQRAVEVDHAAREPHGEPERDLCAVDRRLLHPVRLRPRSCVRLAGSLPGAALSHAVEVSAHGGLGGRESEDGKAISALTRCATLVSPPAVPGSPQNAITSRQTSA
jgi:hypothetical protein